MMGVRKLLDYVFEKHELKILDDILPEFKRHEKLDDEEALELGVSKILCKHVQKEKVTLIIDSVPCIFRRKV